MEIRKEKGKQKKKQEIDAQHLVDKFHLQQTWAELNHKIQSKSKIKKDRT